MNKEDKELLLKDLCARLPYGVKVKLGDNPNVFDLEYRIKFAVMYGDSDKLEDILDITNIKPYLFPLSSMSEEERIAIGNEFAYGQPHKAMDILHKRYIDYRGLIEKGLAIDATGLNIY